MEAFLCKDSEEVAHFIAGFAVKNILQKTNCVECGSKMISEEDNLADGYTEILSRGRLIKPSASVSYAISSCFAQIDRINELIQSSLVRKFWKEASEKYAPQTASSCEVHEDSNRKARIRIVINIYFNNKQKRTGDTIRKEQIVGFKKRQRKKE